MRYYIDSHSGLSHIGRITAIEQIHVGKEILVGRDGLGEFEPDLSDCVSVMEIAKDTYEITAPDETVLDTVYHSAASALDEAYSFLVPLETRISGMAKGHRDIEERHQFDGDQWAASMSGKIAHDLERILAHYKYEQTKRGERPADGPPTGQERHLNTN